MLRQVRLVRSAIRSVETTIGLHLKTLEVEEGKVNRLARQIDGSRTFPIMNVRIIYLDMS